MTEDEKVAQISKILAAWNPLANDQAAAIGLSDYEVEAEDILWAMKLNRYSVKKAVSEVLQQAFLIEVDDSELERFGGEIEAVLAKR